MKRVYGIIDLAEEFGTTKHVLKTFIQLTGYGVKFFRGGKSKRVEYGIEEEKLELVKLVAKEMETSKTVAEAVKKLRERGEL